MRHHLRVAAIERAHIYMTSLTPSTSLKRPRDEDDEFEDIGEIYPTKHAEVHGYIQSLSPIKNNVRVYTVNMLFHFPLRMLYYCFNYHIIITLVRSRSPKMHCILLVYSTVNRNVEVEVDGGDTPLGVVGGL